MDMHYLRLCFDVILKNQKDNSMNVTVCVLAKTTTQLIYIIIHYFRIQWAMYNENIENDGYEKLRLIKKLKFTLCRNK